jgi:flagellar basal body L-ring protein FlgH
LAVALLLAALGAAGCGNRLEDYRKVKPGWTLEQVRQLLGEPDEVQELSGLAAVWTYRSRSLFGGEAVLTVNSVGGRVAFTTVTQEKD